MKGPIEKKQKYPGGKALRRISTLRHNGDYSSRQPKKTPAFQH